jgi:hypothetical protein
LKRLRAYAPWTSIARMHRPSRQLNNLIQKIARKESLAKAHNRKGGKRVKQWKKSVEAFKSLAQDAS